MPDRQVRQKRLGIFTVQFVRGFAIDVEVRLQIDVSSNERPETPFASDNSDLGLYPKKAESLVSRARRAAQNGMHHIVPLSNCDWYDEGPGPNVTLRQATDKDEAFLRKLHREAMGPHVEAALGWWDTDEQEKRFAKAAVSWHQIIVLDGHPIGCLLVFSRSNAVILGRLPLRQGLHNWRWESHARCSALESFPQKRLPPMQQGRECECELTHCRSNGDLP